MEKYLKFFSMVSLVFFLVSCDEDDQETADILNPVVVEESYYFPPLTGEEWELKSAEDLKWDVNKLQEAIDFAESVNSYSLIILHKGRIVTENYWKESDRYTTHELESVAKSMNSFLVGILQDEYDLDINQKVSHYLGNGWSKASKERENEITVKHLLTMSSGLDYELSYLADPDSLWYYSNEAYNVLFRLYEPLTGKNAIDFSKERLFDKIGMSNSVWTDTQLASNSRDMARFGLMILADAHWKEEKLMQDENYFNDMLSPSQANQRAYGYLWWLNGQESYYDEHIINPGAIYPAMPQDAVLAMGRYDQRIEVIPSLDLVVVRQGDNTVLPELGVDSFDNKFWTLLMDAIEHGEE